MWIPVEGGPVVYLEQDGKPYQLEAMDGVLLPARQGDMFQEAKVAIEHYKKLFGSEGYCTIAFGKEGYAVVVSPQGTEAERWRGGAKSVPKAKLPNLPAEVIEHMRRESGGAEPVPKD
jgi:hypothetical protein